MIVFYDLETSGLVPGFDQLLQFGAVLTDRDLVEKERFEIRCRLMPHVVPSPEAMQITGQSIGALTDPARPTHYGMMREIHSRLARWSPALFVGYNSIRFDEEFLRQAFYQTLHSPYLTNNSGNARADALHLMRASAVLRPDIVEVPRDGDGRAVFRLEGLANANGIAHTDAHDALSDVTATIGLCRLVRERAPEIWSGFVALASKAAVKAFVAKEECFLHFRGNEDLRVLAPIATAACNPNLTYCFDLHHDPAEFACRSAEGTAAAAPADPITRLKLNAAPILWPLRTAPPHLLPFLGHIPWQERARSLRRDPALIASLLARAEASERERPTSSDVESQLYACGFWSAADTKLMIRFHEQPWEARPSLARQFADLRLRHIALRLLYLERPDLLEPETLAAADRAVAARTLGAVRGGRRGLTLPEALAALARTLAEPAPGRDVLRGYGVHLAHKLRLASETLDAADPYASVPDAEHRQRDDAT